MKLATYDDNGTKIGIVSGDKIIDANFNGSMSDAIAQWDKLRPQFAALADKGGGKPLSAVKLRAPVLRPGKIFAIGLNYADHIAETKSERPTQQVWFTKAQTSINGPYDPILIARHGPAVDYEVELVAVIGKPGRNIAVEDARHHVFGYCVGNDVTERQWQRNSGRQWALGKSFDTHAPIGPWITTADEIGDPHGLSLSCAVNGETRQSSNTKHLIFNVWDQIAHLSKAMTLEPGDLIFTGTPGGVGNAMDPPKFLKPGDVVRCEIDKLGAIEGVMKAED
jgi:2-keto-4-pentenoate hydratase/2-oxohepta-3-ene-1,7-dioic acid hydratase in catechol pathway